MTCAYSENYLNDAKRCLADMFDYAVNDMKIEINNFADYFIISGYAKEFGQGNPAVISGMSGIELARKIFLFVYQEENSVLHSLSGDRSPEYWAGWALAEYQWYTGKSFKDIFEKIKLSEIVDMYPLFHEIDITQFIHSMEEKYKSIIFETKLKRIRESKGLSQSELSEMSGVSIRSIQMYEQRNNDIDKAQGQTLYKLAHTLSCNVEDLLENPME